MTANTIGEANNDRQGKSQMDATPGIWWKEFLKVIPLSLLTMLTQNLR